MSEKRKARRFARRLKVRFGERGRPFHYNGLTADISASGMFVSTTASIKPGTRVHVEITSHENELLFFEGVVARQVVVPAELRGVVKAGFGLRYLSGVELTQELVPSVKEQTHLQVVFPSLESLRDAWDRELNRGGAFLWADRAYPLNSIVVVEFDLPFAGRRLAFESRVVQCVPEQQGKHGMAFAFLDIPSATAALSSVLHEGWQQ